MSITVLDEISPKFRKMLWAKYGITILDKIIPDGETISTTKIPMITPDGTKELTWVELGEYVKTFRRK